MTAPRRTYSLVIPVYDNERTLPATLASLERLDEKDRWEIVVADDASRDGTLRIARAWAEGPGRAFPRCAIVEGKDNLGISGNHARAFAEARAEYGLYIGGDDLVESPSLAADLDAALAAAPGTRIAKLDVEALYAGSGRREALYRYKRSFFEMSSRRQFAALAVFSNFLYAGPGTLLHLPTLRDIGGGFDPRFRTYEDLPLFYAFLTRGYRMRFLPVRGIAWYRSSSAVSRGGFSKIKSKFAEERALEKAVVLAHSGLLTPYERFLLSIRQYPKYFRYCLYALDPSWLRNRLVPSILKKIRLIKEAP